MARYTVVIPYVYKPYFDECFKGLKLPFNNIVALDNTVNNLGVAGSWNKGIEHMRANGNEWLIIVSAAMRFGAPGGLDMIETLSRNPDADIINFCDLEFQKEDVEWRRRFIRGTTPGVEAGMFSWHCCAISRRVIENVGKFDPNFYPIYFEDIDYDIRINKFYGPTVKWPIKAIEAHSSDVGHGVKLGNVKSESTPLIAYFAEKWGRHPSATSLPTYERPFNNPNNSVAFFPPAHGDLWNE
jgi:hypothetical protein